MELLVQKYWHHFISPCINTRSYVLNLKFSISCKQCKYRAVCVCVCLGYGVLVYLVGWILLPRMYTRLYKSNKYKNMLFTEYYFCKTINKLYFFYLFICLFVYLIEDNCFVKTQLGSNCLFVLQIIKPCFTFKKRTSFWFLIFIVY